MMQICQEQEWRYKATRVALCCEVSNLLVKMLFILFINYIIRPTDLSMQSHFGCLRNAVIKTFQKTNIPKCLFIINET